MPQPSDTGTAPAAPANPGQAAAVTTVPPASGTVQALPANTPRAPWSQVAPDFIAEWGYPDEKFDPEHVEILGPSGSGKTVFEETILTERVAARDSKTIFVATKKSDKQIGALAALGWPVTSSFGDTEQHKQSIFWPQTKLLGRARRAYLAGKVEDLLARLWHENSNTIVAFDEIATVEGLSPEVRTLIYDYWREGRSLGITVVAMKQRPQAIQRDMHSESSWVVSFRPKDEDDGKRYAEIFGSRAYWLPVLMSLDRSKYEFLIQHARTGEAVISWIDVPLEPLPKKHYQARRH
jgi:hypothetical protein